MSARSSEVDAYIAAAPEFARPILTHLRRLVHEACPDLTESIKWRMPNFCRRGIVCNMAAFKAHCSFGLWNHEKALAAAGILPSDDGMGNFGRLTSIADLPADSVLLTIVREAVHLDEAGVSRRADPLKAQKPRPEIPSFLAAALSGNPKAKAAFETFAPGCQREYIEWLAEAKREETRKRRLETALEWMAEGKSRNWKYANC